MPSMFVSDLIRLPYFHADKPTERSDLHWQRQCCGRQVALLLDGQELAAPSNVREQKQRA